MYNLNETERRLRYENEAPEPEQGWFSSMVEAVADFFIEILKMIVGFVVGCLALVWSLLVLVVVAIFSFWPLWLFIIMVVLLYKVL